MNRIELIRVESARAAFRSDSERVSLDDLDELAAELARVFQVSCYVRSESFGADFALDPSRSQFHSTRILQQLDGTAPEAGMHRLAVTGLDLFVPILTFVFGEAQLAGRCALISVHRLGEEFYGMPARDELLRERIVKEAVHELGHTLGLKHCHDWKCVMAASHTVERVDVKTSEFCDACLALAGLHSPAPRMMAM